MKKYFFCSLIALSVVFSACQPNREKRVQEINTSEQELLKTQGEINKEKANEMAQLFSKFANDFPKDSLSPLYLYKAADISMNIENEQAALGFLNTITTQYPNYIHTPECYFLKGYVYEMLNDIPKAKEAYTVFIQKYPSYPMVKDAQFSIENLGVSPEELIKKFEKMDSVGKS